MTEYKATIGLEVHAELKTMTKMFCRCKNDPDEGRPNWNICPICTAQPGTLPVINKKAVEHVLRVGMALGSTLADFTEWDRKNYFYPDIPKGYQISQYKYPLVSGGALSGVELTRVHLEEDTASLMHVSSSPQNIAESTQNNAELIQRPSASSLRESATLVDFNRAGVPLMELVTEPVIHDAETAVKFAKELQLLLRYLGASDANMEKGEMRVEANISIAPTIEILASAEERRFNAEGRGKDADGRETILRKSASSPRESATLGTKVEVKNLNSFKSVGDAIAFEIKRHANVLARGEKVVQETRGWDEDRCMTFSQRKKESANDYRYFPEPDLPKLMTTEVFGENYEKLPALPELPWEKRARLSKEFELPYSVTEMYVSDSLLGGFFEEVVLALRGEKELAKLASNYISSDLAALIKNTDGTIGKISPENFAALVEMTKIGEVSSRGAKNILVIMHGEGGSPRAVARREGLIQKSDAEDLEKIAQEIIDANPNVVLEYKLGKLAALQFLIGEGMKATKGSANPKGLGEVFRTRLKINK